LKFLNALAVKNEIVLPIIAPLFSLNIKSHYFLWVYVYFHILLWRYQLWPHLPEDSRCPESSEGHGTRCCRWLWPCRPSSLLHDVWCYSLTGRQNTLRV